MTREQETVTKCHDLYDEDGGEILNRTKSDTVKGCEWCDGSEKVLLVDDYIPFGSYNSIRLEDGKAFLDDADGFHIRIKFCPMCGRRLEEV